MGAFHAYDIRGIYGVDFDRTTAYKVGYFIPELLGAKEVLVGRDCRVSSQEIRTALQEPIASIVDAVRSTLEHCPPELASDLMDRGIMLAGGGALIRGLANLISEEMNLPVFVAEDPLKAVAEGTGKVLQGMNDMES